MKQGPRRPWESGPLKEPEEQEKEPEEQEKEQEETSPRLFFLDVS